MRVVVDLALHKANEAMKAVAYVQNQLRSDQEQLEQLHQYLEEYRSSSRTHGTQGISVQQFRIYNDFADNVERAIGQQQQQVATVQGQLSQLREHWRKLDARHQGLEKLLNKILLEEDAVAQRQEQKEQDEFASRAGKRVW